MARPLRLNDAETGLQEFKDADTFELGGAATITGAVTIGGNLQGTTGNGYLHMLGDSGATLGLRLTDAGVLLLGTTVSSGAAAGWLGLANGAWLSAANNAGTSQLGIVRINSDNRVEFGPNRAILFGQYLEAPEISDPAAPDANKGRLYFRDDGAGKTQLAVRFPTGAVQVLATEP